MAARLYGLFRRPRNAPRGARWERLYPQRPGLTKNVAIAYYQNALLANAMGQLDAGQEYQLRPITYRR